MPPISPVLLSDGRVLAAYLIFSGSYVVFGMGKFTWMQIDRPGAAVDSFLPQLSSTRQCFGSGESDSRAARRRGEVVYLGGYMIKYE